MHLLTLSPYNVATSFSEITAPCAHPMPLQHQTGRSRFNPHWNANKYYCIIYLSLATIDADMFTVEAIFRKEFCEAFAGVSAVCPLGIYANKERLLRFSREASISSLP